jgi:hypothetical protein
LALVASDVPFVVALVAGIHCRLSSDHDNLAGLVYLEPLYFDPSRLRAARNARVKSCCLKFASPRAITVPYFPRASGLPPSVCVGLIVMHVPLQVSKTRNAKDNYSIFLNTRVGHLALFLGHIALLFSAILLLFPGASLKA